MKKIKTCARGAAILLCSIMSFDSLLAQTDMDAIMLNKKQFCQGVSYEYSSWDHYWEGTYKRDNQNIGTVSTQSLMYMPGYGITNNLNVLASLPYVWTHATAGTLHGQKGIQDLSVFVKWKPLVMSFGKNHLSLYALGGFSTPMSNYIIDYLPLSIGLGTTNLIARGMIDYKRGKFTATAWGSYIWRSNITIDRTAYYDTQQENTDKVAMPNVTTFQLRTGYRSKYVIAEALLTNMTTLGGFDIRKNDMPFPSNRMNSTMVGAYGKYSLKKITGLELVGQVNYTVAGRNVGQSTAFMVGAFYAFYFGKKTKS